jgi:carotenoid cleavage dioxygenase-like enzyme
VHDADRGATELVILAAQDFTADPVARIHWPARIPLGFHGSWVPDAPASGAPGVAGAAGA